MDLNQNANVLSAADLDSLGAEDLLSLDISQVSDLEVFKLKPSGMYGWEITGAEIAEVGEEGDKAIAVTYKLLEVIELSDAAEADDVGDLPCDYTERYKLSGRGSEKGKGVKRFVTIFRPIAVGAGVSQISDILEAIIGATGGGMINKGSFKGDSGVIEYNKIDPTTVEWA